MRVLYRGHPGCLSLLGEGSVWQLMLGTSMNLFRQFFGIWELLLPKVLLVSGEEGGKNLLLLNRNGQRSALGGKLAVYPELGQGSGAESLSWRMQSRSLLHTGTLLNMERPATGRSWSLSANSHVGLQVALKIWFHGTHLTSAVMCKTVGKKAELEKGRNQKILLRVQLLFGCLSDLICNWLCM